MVVFLLMRTAPCFTSGGAGVSVFERGRGTCDGYTEEAPAVTCVEVLKPTKPGWGLHGITVYIILYNIYSIILYKLYIYMCFLYVFFLGVQVILRDIRDVTEEERLHSINCTQ